MVAAKNSKKKKAPKGTQEIVDITPESGPSGGAIVPATPLKPALSAYYQQISQTPLLSAQEEKALALKVYEHQNSEAFKHLVQANLRFVVKIAFEYSRYGAQVLDLIQEGNMGLIKAVQEFNPYKDVRLTTYAVWWIRSYIQDYLLRNWSIVRIGTTAAQKKLFYRLKKEQMRFEREGISPRPKAIAMELGVDEEDVKMMQVRLAGKDLSLSPAPPSENTEGLSLSAKLADTAPLASTDLEQSEQTELFKKALDEFASDLNDERELQIFRERMLAEKPKTLAEIGKEYGFSKERARQLEERVMKKLKEFLAKYYPDISMN